MTQGRLKDIFASEIQQGIRIFSGGRDVVDYSAEMTQDEIDSIYYCFDTNLKKLENISPKLAASYRPQREACVKWARIAKGTFPEVKNYSYPGQSGGLACDWLNPYLFGYGNAAAGTGDRDYLDIAGAADTAVLMSDWNITFTVDTVRKLLSNSTTGATSYYRGCATTGAHSFVVLFQDGIVQMGGTPLIQELYFKSEIMDMYSPISVPPLIRQTIEKGKEIYQFTTPGMIGIDHNVGYWIAGGVPTATATVCMPLMGMVFYETGFNLSTMIAH